MNQFLFKSQILTACVETKSFIFKKLKHFIFKWMTFLFLKIKKKNIKQRILLIFTDALEIWDHLNEYWSRFALVSLFNGISTRFRLFNAKAILLEEQ